MPAVKLNYPVSLDYPMTWIRLLLLAFLLAGMVRAEQVEQHDSKPAHVGKGAHFQASDRCIACHNGVTTAGGQDISIAGSWRATMMANSARDPYWQAGVRRETLDHPMAKAAIENECSTCHMPMDHYESKLKGQMSEVFSHLPLNLSKPEDRLAADGVSCSLCHQITSEKLGTKESLVGKFVVDATHAEGDRTVFGPYDIDAGRASVMRSSSGFRPTKGDHIRQSELCATCHTLYTQALGPKGEVIGELPEQVPYQEWLHSEYRGKQSCASCHMPVVAGEAPITGVLSKEHPGVSQHVFVGGNFLMQRILNRYRNDLGVEALPEELDAAANRTVEHLQLEAARVSISGAEVRDGRLLAEVVVQNLGGHKLPTAYPSRRVWLHVTVKDSNGGVVFESGALTPEGAIRGNDNDEDARKFEPHYREITSGGQVQIYESIMVDTSGVVTTGLLSAVRFAKDNRLLPRGFDKATADAEVAVHGDASDDNDFAGGEDRVRYSVALGKAQGPLKIDAELWYQPISYRWASNLRPYEAMETQRFTRYYDSMAASSAVILGKASLTH
jgi:hypothetical protein